MLQNREWISEFAFRKHERDILVRLKCVIDVPFIVQWGSSLVFHSHKEELGIGKRRKNAGKGQFIHKLAVESAVKFPTSKTRR